MKTAFSWLNDRTGFADWLSRLTDSPMAGRACWCRVLPSVVALLFCVQAIAGFFLWVYYSPSATSAWESVYYLQTEVTGGWFLRAIHHYTAHMLVAVLMIWIVQSILTRRCRAPGELVFWATVALGLCVLAAILTGDLLAWDQNGYAATKTRTGFLALLPWVGDSLVKLAIGGPGPALGNLTLTRIFALHVGLFATGFFVLLIVRGILARRANAAQATESRTTVAYWPAQAWRDAVAGLVVLGVVVLLACRDLGAPLLSPADTDPMNAYAAARPEWFLTGVYEFSHLFTGPWQVLPIFVIPGLVVCVMLAMPFLARSRVGHVFNVVFTLALVAALGGLTYESLVEDRDDAQHQQAIAFEHWQARRIDELIRHEGIPPAGALTLLRNDPETQGPRLFVQQCSICHDHLAGPGGDPMAEIKAEESTSPNLAGFASRRWLAGLLDPKKINGPEYFGNTAFRGGKMADFVKNTFSEFEADERAGIIAALSAEAELPSQRLIDAQDAKLIAEGRTLITEEAGCTECHKFRGHGQLGTAPELTGYGSARWTTGILRDPAHVRFYGKHNDRMPAYAASETDPSLNTLDARRIELLVKWLRGEWYEEGREESGEGRGAGKSEIIHPKS